MHIVMIINTILHQTKQTIIRHLTRIIIINTINMIYVGFIKQNIMIVTVFILVKQIDHKK